jgi:hypothetical protein
LRAGLAVGRYAAGIVVGRAGDETGAESADYALAESEQQTRQRHSAASLLSPRAHRRCVIHVAKPAAPSAASIWPAMIKICKHPK